MSAADVRTLRPRGVRVVAVTAGLLLVTVCVVIWLALPAEVQAKFNLIQGATFAAFGGLGGVALWALIRCRVDLSEQGITIVNGFTTHRYSWPEIVAITLTPGNPWAVLDLSDGTTVSAVGIQGSDGALAKSQVREVREYIKKFGTATDG